MADRERHRDARVEELLERGGRRRSASNAAVEVVTRRRDRHGHRARRRPRPVHRASRPDDRRRPAPRLPHGGAPQRAASGKRIVIDAEGYRARREEALQRQADQAADDALPLRAPGRAGRDDGERAQARARVPARPRRRRDVLRGRRARSPPRRRSAERGRALHAFHVGGDRRQGVSCDPSGGGGAASAHARWIARRWFHVQARRVDPAQARPARCRASRLGGPPRVHPARCVSRETLPTVANARHARGSHDAHGLPRSHERSRRRATPRPSAEPF